MSTVLMGAKVPLMMRCICSGKVFTTPRPAKRQRCCSCSPSTEVNSGTLDSGHLSEFSDSLSLSF